ncbi:hypothetical protein D9758_007475 [Tetrapyrgos nigripes]|uniref:ribonuclease H n=1 Tax=Tetrapyrgos nigripes TaxID=182062 RepID=A0A8H5LHS7_9AGAR|nr:hypothetical protein D9758_007475 [Tetrapyrgos nigripes]
MVRAQQLLDTLPSKWDPRSDLPEDHELSPALLNAARTDGWEPFDRTITTDGDLSDIFRIFVDKKAKPTTNSHIPHHETLPEGANPKITLATDGSCINNGEENARAGAGIFIEDNHDLNRKIKLPLYIAQSNQTGELVAAKVAAETTPQYLQLNIETDSKYVLNLLTRDMKQHEDEGYTTTANPDLVQSTVASFRARTTLTHLKWVKGHAGNARNEGADTLAKLALDKHRPSYINTTPMPTLQVHGAKLKSMTQALAYQAILQRKSNDGATDRPRTKTNISFVKACINQKFEYIPTDAAFWASIRHKDLNKKTRYFLWMAAHDAYMIGSHWQR